MEQLEVLRELLPAATSMAALVNNSAAPAVKREAEEDWGR